MSNPRSRNISSENDLFQVSISSGRGLRELNSIFKGTGFGFVVGLVTWRGRTERVGQLGLAVGYVST